MKSIGQFDFVNARNIRRMTSICDSLSRYFDVILLSDHMFVVISFRSRVLKRRSHLMDVK